jgi:hypothetical protein
MNLQWASISYVVVVIDSSAWNIAVRSNGGASVEFEEDLATGVLGNHSFFDAWVEPIDTPSFAQRDAVIFINHSKRDVAGTELGVGLPKGQVEKQKFKFNLFCDVTTTSGEEEWTDGKIVVMLDPGGENTGPPIGPPFIAPPLAAE